MFYIKTSLILCISIFLHFESISIENVNTFYINKYDTLINIFNQYDYTILFNLLLENCIGCSNTNLNIVNKMINDSKYKICKMYYFQGLLNKNQKIFLKEKYLTEYIFDKKDTFITKYFNINLNTTLYVVDNSGIEIYKGNINKISNVNQIFNKRILKLSHIAKLDTIDEGIILPIKIQYAEKMNKIMILDQFLNKIKSYDIYSGKLIKSYTVPQEINDYFEKIDTSFLSLKWKYKQPSYFESFLLIDTSLDKLIEVFRSFNIKVDFNTRNNKIDTIINIIPKIIICNKMRDSVVFIKIDSSKYYIEYDKLIKIGNNYISSITGAIDNNNCKNLEFENDPIFISLDEDFKYNHTLITRSDIKKITNKDYYSLFASQYTSNKYNSFVVFNDFNASYFTFIISKEKVYLYNINLHGILNSNYQYYINLNLTPEFILNNLDFKFNNYYTINNIFCTDSLFHVLISLSSETYSKNIKFLVIQNYDFKGKFINENIIRLNYDDILNEIYFAGKNINNIFFLCKVNNDFWCIKKLNLEELIKI